MARGGSVLATMKCRLEGDPAVSAPVSPPPGETIQRVDATELQRWCLQQPGSFEDFPFGPEHSVFKVAGKMFALSALARAPLEVSVKCEPELAVDLRNTYPAIRPGYHLNKRHWNTITVDGSLPDQLVRDLIEDSYDLVVDGLPKRARDQLAAGRLSRSSRDAGVRASS
jgi:predicted DNA-binding protein (MmcQ/YjbR family)